MVWLRTAALVHGSTWLGGNGNAFLYSPSFPFEEFPSSIRENFKTTKL